MKQKLFAEMVSVILLLTLAGCGSGSVSEQTASSDTVPEISAQSDAPDSISSSANALVVYFSWSGNTRAIAEEIAVQTGADTFELLPTQAYSTDYNTVLDEAQTEQSNNARPEITGTIDNIADYDVIYLGFPNWWGDMPMILYSFLDDYDLSGKTICPFVSSGGSGFSNTISSIESAEPNATIADGLFLSGNASQNPADSVTEWLSKIGQ